MFVFYVTFDFLTSIANPPLLPVCPTSALAL